MKILMAFYMLLDDKFNIVLTRRSHIFLKTDAPMITFKGHLYCKVGENEYLFSHLFYTQNMSHLTNTNCGRIGNKGSL